MKISFFPEYIYSYSKKTLPWFRCFGHDETTLILHAWSVILHAWSVILHAWSVILHAWSVSITALRYYRRLLCRGVRIPTFFSPDPILFCKSLIRIRSRSGISVTQAIRLLF